MAHLTPLVFSQEEPKTEASSQGSPPDTPQPALAVTDATDDAPPAPIDVADSFQSDADPEAAVTVVTAGTPEAAITPSSVTPVTLPAPPEVVSPSIRRVSSQDDAPLLDTLSKGTPVGIWGAALPPISPKPHRDPS